MEEGEAENKQFDIADKFVAMKFTTNDATTKPDKPIVSVDNSGEGSAAVKVAWTVNDDICDDQNYVKIMTDFDCELF